VPAPPDFTLTATPSTQTVSAGTAAGFTVGVGSQNGFTGDVALSVGGLPATVGSATFTPAIVAGAGSSQLTITTLTTAPGGTYPLTVSATSGTTTHTSAVALTVRARDFTISAGPASVTVTRGQTATYTVTVASLNGFTGPVTLSVGGAPAGSVASWAGNPVTAPGGATLRIRTTASTPRGTFTLKLTGKSGALSHQTSTTLVVR
jgi:hypothetical protein